MRDNASRRRKVLRVGLPCRIAYDSPDPDERIPMEHRIVDRKRVGHAVAIGY